MISQWGIYILLTLISFFPMVIWAYIFSYVDDNPFHKKRFFMGMFGGALAVLPILYIEKIIHVVWIEYLNVFYYISQIGTFFSSLEMAFSLMLVLGMIVTISLIYGFLILKIQKKILILYLKNIWVFLCLIFGASFLLYGVNILLGDWDYVLWSWVAFWDVVFQSLKLIVFYYFIVAFIEESSKHFNFLQSSVSDITTPKLWVLSAIFIALGFACIENMLYLYSFYIQYGIGGEMLKIYFFRSVFSVMVHVVCSSVVAYFFSRALLHYAHRHLRWMYLKVFLGGLIFSLWLHLIFDVALTLWWSIVLFVYFLWGYVYVSSLFYRDEPEEF